VLWHSAATFHAARSRHGRVASRPIYQVMTNILNLVPAEAERQLADLLRSAGEPPYRVAQVLYRLWRLPAAHWDAMTELPKATRALLASHLYLPRLALEARQISGDGTQKFLFRLGDGQAIETVAIPEGRRLTVCVSSQAGCALKCAFCATGAMGFARNLEPFEIAGQLRELMLLSPPLRPTNVVFMGMGEPLMNWKAVSVALSIMNAPAGLGIGARHITVSTVGVLPGIAALGQRPEQFRLALSIHAPSEGLRRMLMPVNTKYPLAQILEAAKAFKRRVTFEYVMLDGVNDAEEHALALAKMARDCGAFVNLIPLHPGGSGDFQASPPRVMRRFAEVLRGQGVEVAIRKSRGLDIAAACGQLRVERLRRRLPVAPQAHREVEIARTIG
jgi:23S rRNA (adenine2503-C2)-methyltransferase